MVSVADDLTEMLIQARIATALFQQQYEQFKNPHTCAKAHLRNPWPWNPNCKGCLAELDKHVKRFHLQTPYALFGFDVIVDHYIATITRMNDRAEAYRQLGAYI